MSYSLQSSDERTSHNKVNLGRILSRLDKNVKAGVEGKTWWEVRKLSEDAKYARQLLDSVIAEEGDAPGTSDAFSKFESTLNRISMSLILAQPSPPSLPLTPIYSFPPPPAPTKAPTPSLSSRVSSNPLESIILPSQPNEPQPDLILGESAPSSSDPLLAEDDSSTHVFASALQQSHSHSSPKIPTATSTENEKSHQLLGPPRPREEVLQLQKEKSENEKSGLMGSTSRLHDELTEQLAQMSTQLRKNALHFSNSLEAEKPLLEQGASLLESNISRLTGSAGRLGAVSTSGRSNTWLVLGACAVVTLAWFWMYLIIRMT
ncbi:hypothetical protein BDY24DRAFT_382750 [Mrakia frigida]|uniref:uncharacterized protein n=1 Tax=Mrakia frigida TaxID=29902 RepID=UPI003FCBF21E